MTLTIHDLTEFRRRERDDPRITTPSPNFLDDLKTYLDKIKQEAGPHPAQWDLDCEALAAMDLVQEIFRIRRSKLARIAELNPDDATTPAPKQLFLFENCAWFGLTATYRLLDKTIEQVCQTGTWSGRWGE
jgi:hypothetical protein